MKKTIVLLSALFVFTLSILVYVPKVDAAVYKWENLAIPDLENAEYLGDGIYSFYEIDGFSITYNVKNGHFVFNGNATITDYISNTLFLFDQTTKGLKGDYTLTYNYISGNIDMPKDNYIFGINYSNFIVFHYIGINNYDKDIYITKNLTNVPDIFPLTMYVYRKVPYVMNDFTFKIMLNKGTIAQPYIVPKVLSDDDFDGGEMFKTLYNTGKIIVQKGQEGWFWLNTEHHFGIKLFTFNIGFEFVPMNYLGTAILSLLVWWVIKALVPGA